MFGSSINHIREIDGAAYLTPRAFKSAISFARSCPITPSSSSCRPPSNGDSGVLFMLQQARISKIRLAQRASEWDVCVRVCVVTWSVRRLQRESLTSRIDRCTCLAPCIRHHISTVTHPA